MDPFKNREKGFESKFAHDQDVEFRIAARANRHLGLWAAELLGKTGEAAQDYAIEVVLADLRASGHEDVVQKVAADLGDLADEALVRAELAVRTRLARTQLTGEGAEGA